MFEILNCYTGALLYRSESAATLSEAALEAVKARADLEGADLEGADLEGADLAGANLAGAYLAGAYLAGANLTRANLAGANLTRAHLAGANLAGANLAGAKGLLANGLVPLQILGTRHSLIVCKPGVVKIGCLEHPLAWWEEHYESAGRGEHYSEPQIAEYRAHIAHAREWMEAYGVDKEVPA
jgi:hypothetical protein